MAESSTFVGTHYILGSCVIFAHSLIEALIYLYASCLTTVGINQKNSANVLEYSQALGSSGRCKHTEWSQLNTHYIVFKVLGGTSGCSVQASKSIGIATFRPNQNGPEPDT